MDQRHMDLAASIQAVTEEVVLRALPKNLWVEIIPMGSDSWGAGTCCG